MGHWQMQNYFSLAIAKNKAVFRWPVAKIELLFIGLWLFYGHQNQLFPLSLVAPAAAGARPARRTSWLSSGPRGLSGEAAKGGRAMSDRRRRERRWRRPGGLKPMAIEKPLANGEQFLFLPWANGR